MSSRGRRWLIGGVTAWALVLSGLALLSVWRDPPSIPEQRDLPTVLPALDRATGAVLAAVGSDGVVEFGPLRVVRGCRITPIRAGAEAIREVTVYVRPGAGPTALRRIAIDLPTTYGAHIGTSRLDTDSGSGTESGTGSGSGSGPGSGSGSGSGSRGTGSGSRLVLRADAGDYIAVRGTASADSTVLSVSAATGCRPPGTGLPPSESPTGPPSESPTGPPSESPTGPPSESPTGPPSESPTGPPSESPSGLPSGPPSGSLPEALTVVLTALKAPDTGATARELPCPDGATARAVTVQAAARPGMRGLDKALASVTADATVVEAAPERYAYRIADESVLVTTVGGRLRVTATKTC